MLPPPPVEASLVRPESPQLTRSFLGPGATLELTVRTDHPVGRGPEVRVAGELMACEALDGTRQAYRCTRAVDAEPALGEGVHGFTFAALAADAPSDALFVPVELGLKVVVDRTPPVLATAELPSVVFDGQPFKLTIATSEALDSEAVPTFTLSEGTFRQGTPVRFSTGWQVEVTVQGTPDAPVVPRDTLAPTAADPAPAIIVHQQDKAGNEAAELRLPLVVRAPGAPRVELSAVDEQKRPPAGDWVAVSSLRSRVRMEFLADRPIVAWDGAANRNLPLQCQPMPAVKLAESDAPNRRVWPGLCLGITPNDWEDEATTLAGTVKATEQAGGVPWQGTFALQFDLTAPVLGHPENLRIVRREVGADDELATTNALLRTAAADASRYVSTDVEAGISHLLVYGSPSGGTALVRLPMPVAGAPADEPVIRALRGTNGLGGALALQRAYVSAVDLFGNESPRVALPDDGAPSIDPALVRIVRTDDRTGDELVATPGAFNQGSETACPIVRVDVFTEPPSRPLPLTSLPRTGEFPAQVLAPAPLRVFLEAVDKAGRVSVRSEVANADTAAPVVNVEKLVVRRGAVGEPDRIEWSSLAFDADRLDTSPIVEVQFYDQERGGAAVGVVPTPLLTRFGAFFPGVAVGAASRGPRRLFVEATDETRLTSERAELNGADLLPPRLVASEFELERRALGLADRISWTADAAEDPSAITELRFYESAAATSPPVAHWTAPAGTLALPAASVELSFTDRSVRRLFVEAEDKTGASSERLELPALADLAPPQVQVSLLSIARRPIGLPDVVESFGDAIDDASALSKVEFLDGVDGALLAEIEPAATGTFSAVPLGGADAPARVFIRATDKTGLVSNVVEIPTGRDLVPPTIDTPRLTLVRQPVGMVDEVRWSAEAVTDASAVRELRFFETATLTDEPFAIWNAPAGATRLVASFSEFPEPSRSPRRVYVEAIDKTGASTGRVWIAAASDADPPVITASLLAIQRRTVGVPDGVAAQADAIADASAVASIELLDAPGGASLARVRPAPEGTFDPIDVGTATAAPKRVYVVATDKTGLASEPVEITAGAAPAAPTVTPGLAGLARRSLGTPDEAFGQPGALRGASVPVAVEILGSAAPAALPLARANAAADGSFPYTAVGTGSSAPASIFLVAIDKTGQRSEPVQGGLGIDTTAPVADASVAQIVRKALGTPDTVRGAARTCSDANAVARAELAGDATGAPVLAAATPSADGSFLDIGVGTGTAAPPRVWLRCVDKAGNEGVWSEVATGKDTEPPSVNYALLTFVATASPGDDLLSGAVGALTDNLTPVRTVRVFTTPWADDGVPSIATFTPTALGSFPATPLGDTALTGVSGVYLEAEDKCGNRNNRAQNRANLYTVNSGPHVPYDFSTPGARLYPVKADVDPRSASPAIGPALWPELDLAGNAAAASGDSATVDVSAAAELRTVAPTWTRVPAFVSGFAKHVFDSGSSRFLAIGPGETNLESWAWNGVSWVQVVGGNPPPNRTDFSLAHDAVNHVTYLFGGRSGTNYFAELWSFDGAAWRLEASGPSARINPGWVHDPDYGRVLLFGGTDAAGVALKDQWSFSAGAWTQDTPATTPNDAGLCLVHNPDGRELILLRNDMKLFACYPVNSQPIAETWSLKGNVWTRVAEDKMCDYTISWDTGCVHIPAGSGFGGSNEARVLGIRKSSAGASPRSLVSLSAGTRWAGLVSSGAVDLGGENWSSLAYDPVNKQVMALETYSGFTRTAGRYGGARILKTRNGVLESTMAVAGMMIGRRDYSGNASGGPLAWRPRTREMSWGAGRVQGSAPGFSAFLGSVGQWRAVGAQASSTNENIMGHFPYADVTWRQVAGSIPATTATMIPYSTFKPVTAPALPISGTIYRTPAWSDPLHDGTVVSNSNSGYLLVYRDGSGVASLSNIYSIRVGWAGGYDVGRGRSIVLQGAPTQHWANSGNLTMLQQSIATLPPARTGPGFSYDAGIDRMVLHGGTGLNDTWEWDGSAWTSVTTIGAPPVPSSGIEFAYDAERGRHLRMTDSDLWEYEHVVPHRRFAAVLGFFPFTSAETLFGMTVRAVAGGGSPAGNGFSVHVWDFTNQRWDLLGSSTAAPDSPASERTLRLPVALSGSTRYLRRGAWLLVTANGSSAPTDASQAPSRLSLDALEFQYLTQVQ